ncbi:hypothetical protein [Roseateles albus]|uniref:Uncharacterized protein n=1 Tax=Roseateles albus TaxID=2987525 RepID=A0ABT5KDW9_9BURK|nr:hypothetical protein [Roseateles albus]MDC8772088.1 hypothetical protein [Roseateles albus]
MDESTINALASNPWVTLGGFIIGALGLVLAIVFYAKSKKDRLPFYEVSTSTLIDGVDKALDGLQLYYKEQLQSRITVTKIVLWNDGRETIDKNDLAELDPVRVSCSSGTDILDIQVTQISSVANAVRIGESSEFNKQKYYPIIFEYLDHNDYFVIQIVHNGDECQRFSVDGKIKGVLKIERAANSVFESRLMQYLRYMPFMPHAEILLASRKVMKNAVTTAYFLLFAIGVWTLSHGVNGWYVWAGTALSFLSAIIFYYGFGRIAPVNISSSISERLQMGSRTGLVNNGKS